MGGRNSRGFAVIPGRTGCGCSCRIPVTKLEALLGRTDRSAIDLYIAILDHGRVLDSNGQPSDDAHVVEVTVPTASNIIGRLRGLEFIP